MLRGCAFDLGNTLVNDAAALEESVADMDRWLCETGRVSRPGAFAGVYASVNRASEEPFVSHTYGEERFFARAFAQLGITSITPATALATYRGFLSGRMVVAHGVAASLRWLRARGIRTALVTNESVARVDAFLALNDGTTLFDQIVVSQAVGVEKPHPAIFAETLTRLGLPASEVVMIGDNEIADGACRAVGIPFVLATAFKRSGWGWETGTVHAPDWTIERIDIPALELILARFESPQRVTTDEKRTPHQRNLNTRMDS